MTTPDPRFDSEGRPLPVSHCPACGYKLDTATAAVTKDCRPAPDDVSLCLECGEILIFNEDMTLRRADLNDLLDMPKRQMRVLTAAQELIRVLRGKYKLCDIRNK